MRAERAVRVSGAGGSKRSDLTRVYVRVAWVGRGCGVGAVYVLCVLLLHECVWRPKGWDGSVCVLMVRMGGRVIGWAKGCVVCVCVCACVYVPPVGV